jgi:hypothetical protein
MTDLFQMRGLWQAHHRLTLGVTGHRNETATRTILSCVEHGVTPVVRAFAMRLALRHGVVAVGFHVETGGAA